MPDLTPGDVQTPLPRRHPDLFTPEDAAAYLHLPGPKQLEKLRADGLLVGHAGWVTHLMYWREDLDKCARRMAGRDPSRDVAPHKLRYGS